ncbi:MAG: ANTAR domain-containing protein, partial [Stackebrandtia sp.]
LPLRIGALHVGVLNLHRRAPGELTAVELADALIFAEAATLLILDRSATDGTRAPQLRIHHRIAVHQATGVIMAQLDIGVEEAFVRLRAHTYVDGRSLDVVAAEVVARRIRFDVEEEQ